MSLLNEFKKEKQSENICDNCGYLMIKIKGKKRTKYSKSSNIYSCENCGNKFRERTNNEILRDMGERE